MEELSRKQQLSRAMSALVSFGRQHRAMIDRATSKLGIHRSQHKLLVHLESLKSEPSQREICEHFDLSAATVAVTLKKLEKNGYIERRPSGEDNRVNLIAITKQGREQLLRTREIFDKCDEIAFDGFSADELAVLASMLERMKANIEKAENTDTTRKEEKI